MLSSENDQKICSNCSYQNCIEHELNNWVIKEKIDSPQSSMSSSSASLYDLLTNEQSILQCSSNKSPSMISETPVRKIRNVRKSENHHCAVCGDRPTGYHYNVLSCNGCKTFFRRTVINHRTFTCTKGGKCQFTKDFRCACRACRFEKCVRVGMKTSAIQFSQASGNVIEIEDDQKEVSRKNSLNRNRHLSTFPMVRRPLAEFKSNIYRMVKEIAHKEKFISKYRVAGVIHVEADLSLSEVLRSKKILRRLKETFIPGVFYHRDPVKYWMISDLHLVVEFAKMFSVFQELDEYDQRCLLHQVGGSLHVAVQSFYSFFNAKSDCIVFPDQVKAYEAKMAIVKNDPRSDIFVSYYSEMYTHPVYDLIRSDMNEVEFSFFKALLLFRPDNIDMSLEGRSTVNKEQNRLSNLLRNYLVQEYGPQIGICRLSTILLLLTTFINYGEKRREYLTLVKLLQFKVARIGTDVYIKKPEKL